MGSVKKNCTIWFFKPEFIMNRENRVTMVTVRQKEMSQNGNIFNQGNIWLIQYIPERNMGAGLMRIKRIN